MRRAGDRPRREATAPRRGERARPAQVLRRACRRSTASTSTSAAARCSPSSAPTAPARPRSSRSSRATASPTPARSTSSATTPRKRERAFRARIGIVLQEDGIDAEPDRARGRRALQRRLPAPARRATRSSSSSGSATAPDVRVAALSGGQRRRLDLALGIAGDPELVFLDEPTTGFDPSARRQSWELISALRDLGKTILLTTHYMEEAQHLADRVVVIARGRVSPRARRTRSAPASPRRRSSPSASRTASTATRCRCPRRRGRAPRPARRLPHPHPDARPRARCSPWAAERGDRARGPDRHPAQPRGRLPPAHRGARMTMTRSDLALLGRWLRARVRIQLRTGARRRLHLRLPARAARALQRAQRQRDRGRGGRRRPGASSPSSTRRRSASSASRPRATRR